jgi:phosphohistidine phosphatase
MARELAARRDGIPSLILCSPARRTVETLQALRPHLGSDCAVRTEEPLYLASAAALAERLRDIPDDQAGALLIGHDPGLHDLALALVHPDGSRAYHQLREKLPTGALVELELRLTSWRDLAPGAARLVAFTRPRDLA